jgi:hypothetical protein
MPELASVASESVDAFAGANEHIGWLAIRHALAQGGGKAKDSHDFMTRSSFELWCKVLDSALDANCNQSLDLCGFHRTVKLRTEDKNCRAKQSPYR